MGAKCNIYTRKEHVYEVGFVVGDKMEKIEVVANSVNSSDSILTFYHEDMMVSIVKNWIYFSIIESWIEEDERK